MGAVVVDGVIVELIRSCTSHCLANYTSSVSINEAHLEVVDTIAVLPQLQN